MKGYFIKVSYAPVNPRPTRESNPVYEDRSTIRYSHQQPIYGVPEGQDREAVLAWRRILAQNPQLRSKMIGGALDAAGHPVLSFLQGTQLGGILGPDQYGVPIIGDLIQTEVFKRMGLGGRYNPAWDDAVKGQPDRDKQYGTRTIGQMRRQQRLAQTRSSRDLSDMRAIADNNPQFTHKLVSGLVDQAGEDSPEAKQYKTYQRWAGRIPVKKWRDQAQQYIDGKALDAVGITYAKPTLSTGYKRNPNVIQPGSSA